MHNKIPLRKSYDVVAESFQGINHSPEKFKEDILSVLRGDPVRTFGVRKGIEKTGLNYELSRNFPLNDFLSGAHKYLLHSGVSMKDADVFERKYSNKDILFG